MKRYQGWMMVESEKPQRRVVCAANRMPDGTMFIGARHWDDHMRDQAGAYVAATMTCASVATAEQGFIDQWGEFMTRDEAWEVAVAAGQIYRTGPGFDGPELYSENLY